MKRTLTVVFANNGNTHANLKTLDNIAMDEYTSFNFENQDEIRKRYCYEIAKFIYGSRTMIENDGYIALRDTLNEHNHFSTVLYRMDIITARLVVSYNFVKNTLNEIEEKGKYKPNFGFLYNFDTIERISFEGEFGSREFFKSYIDISRYDTLLYEKIRLINKIYDKERIKYHTPTRARLYKEFKKEYLKEVNHERVIRKVL